MTDLILSLALFIVVIALLVRLWVVDKITDQRTQEYINAEAAVHAKCVAHMAAYVGDEFAAQVLEAAAHDYDSPDGQGQLRVLSHQYKSDGPSMPSMWLSHRAETLREAWTDD